MANQFASKLITVDGRFGEEMEQEVIKLQERLNIE